MAANLFEPKWDDEHDREGFRYKRARLGRQAGAKQLGASLYELEPGECAWPYHWHGGNEEILFVVAGTPDLRTPEGWRRLEAGEVASFPAGQAGAHQIANRADSTARILMVSEMKAPEVAGYPDSGKVSASQRPPGSPGDEDVVSGFFRLEDQVDYWEGETPPAPEP
jgi:uncharacterized cupin superfamily protein